jgi:hypothetical protein
MEPKISSPCSQEPATKPFPETDESNTQPKFISSRPLLILSSHLHLGPPPICLVCLGFPSKVF